MTTGFSSTARAALGDDVGAIVNDRARLHASLRITTMKGYVIHELTSPAGATVREYVGTHGKVFGVSWSGAWRPNLRDILGTHYDEFAAAKRNQPRARGQVRVEVPGMVVVMGGYLRTFWGQAYLTDLAPAGWPAPADDSKGTGGGTP